ncbi:MAG TPA: ATP-binding protein [Vicinamibacterales bacterium]|nr:ATP-binding protein [Vicinamibacterales bacterium]
MRRGWPEAARLVVALLAVAAVTLVYVRWLQVRNAATVSTTFLMVVLVVAATSRLWLAVVTSVVAMACFNFFFLPPVGTLTIADPHNWVALFAFLAVSLVASNLSAVAQARTAEAIGRRDELARLFDLSRDVLVITDSRQAMSILTRSLARRFDLQFVAIALPREGDWDVFEAGARTIALDERELSQAFAAAQTSYEFDAHARTYAGHRTVAIDGATIRLVPLRVGTKPIGLLAATGRPIEPGTLDTLAGVVAIAVERAQFLEERKAADLTRQSEELKSALLASLGHDLRTPLTAIRIAASNLKAAELGDGDRAEQSDVILTEAERLTRLFENILEMARIDAGGVAADSRWAHPSEIIAAARAQLEQTLAGHPVDVVVDPDVPVQLDPRLTGSALAHVLENAAQYAPAGSTIHVQANVTDEGLVVRVRDHGPGIGSAELGHLFERFYRGDAGRSRVSGTGVGLSIARELLAVEGGRIWAENRPEGGAEFTIVVPAAVKASPQAVS